MPRYRKRVVLSRSQKTCETCRFNSVIGCPIPHDPQMSASNRWLAIEFLNEHRNNPHLDCLIWEPLGNAPT